MEEITLKELDPRLQKQIENARKSLDKNPTYSVDVLINIVNRNRAVLKRASICGKRSKKL